jgi:hypothetical protein
MAENKLVIMIRVTYKKSKIYNKLRWQKLKYFLDKCRKKLIKISFYAHEYSCDYTKLVMAKNLAKYFLIIIQM